MGRMCPVRTKTVRPGTSREWDVTLAPDISTASNRLDLSRSLCSITLQAGGGTSLGIGTCPSGELLRQASHVAQVGGDVMIATFLMRCEAESSGGNIPSGPGPAQMDDCGELQPLACAGGHPTAKRER